MLGDRLWRFFFCAAIAVLMAGLLLIRDEQSPLWVLITYPLVGAALANIASRTSPSQREIARVETGVIAAAAIFVLASLVNLLLIEFLLNAVYVLNQNSATMLQRWSVVVLPLVSVLLWWALQRRLTRWRNARQQGAENDASGRTTTSKGDRPL